MSGIDNSHGSKTFRYSDCKIKFDETLGSGRAMNVYRGTCNINGTEEHVAFKFPRQLACRTLKPASVEDAFTKLEKEIKYMKRLANKNNIIQFYGLVMKGDNYQRPILILELATCDLEEYLQNQTHTVDSNRMLDFCRQIANGVHAIHNARIIHGDLKGSNILVFEKDDGTVALKLSDFGYSSSLSSSTGRSGQTIKFTAPECLPDAQHHPELREYYDTSALRYDPRLQLKDIYSYGLVVWQIVNNGNVPFSNLSRNETIKVKMSGNLDDLLSELPKDTPTLLRNIIKHTTKLNPGERMKLRQLMNDLGLPTSQLVDVPLEEIKTECASCGSFNRYGSAVVHTITPPSSDTLSSYVRAFLDAVQAENGDLTSQNEGLERAIIESRDQRTLFEEDSSPTRFVLYANAISIFFSIALYFGPGTLFMIAHLIISIGCSTAAWLAFYNFWMIEQFDPSLISNRRTLLIQINALSFLVFEVWWASNDLLTKSETFRPTVLNAFFLWGCVNSTLITIVAQHAHQPNNVILGPRIS